MHVNLSFFVDLTGLSEEKYVSNISLWNILLHTLDLASLLLLNIKYIRSR